MKTLYESILTGKVTKPIAKVQPSSKDELKQIIDEHIKRIKPRPGQEVNLNWIDISGVDDLSWLFNHVDYVPVIDTWKIDHVKNFRGMFRCNSHIVRSPISVLQEKLLGENCYAYMFYDCTALEVTPQLPAKQLILGCYLQMFRGCTSLKVAPELPATMLARGCYYAMFGDCESLKNPPELPAKKLKLACYDNMFNNCKSLKNKAKIPIGVNLNIHAAQDMYKGCPCENK